MKKAFLTTLLFTSLYCMASKTDSLFQKHQISVSMTNAMSQEFFSNNSNVPSSSAYGYVIIFPYARAVYHYLPVYAFHLQLHYSIGISPSLKLQTGIGYLINTNIIHLAVSQAGQADINVGKQFILTGNITLPLYLKYTQPIRTGALSFKFGPDFTLPVHSHVENTFYAYIVQQSTTNTRYTTDQTGHFTTMGLHASMAYEKEIQKNMTVEVGPVLDFFGLAKFHNNELLYPGSGNHPFQYYLGLNVALAFGIGK